MPQTEIVSTLSAVAGKQSKYLGIIRWETLPPCHPKERLKNYIRKDGRSEADGGVVYMIL